MASGWGITGNKGRCYNFWMDFSECMSHCREPEDCSLLREDYLECLHHSKSFKEGIGYTRRSSLEESLVNHPPPNLLLSFHVHCLNYDLLPTYET